MNINPQADVYTQETIRALLASACIKAPYPQVIEEKDIDLQAEETFAKMHAFVHAIRNIRAEMQIPPSEKTDLILIGAGPEAEMVKEHQSILQALTPTKSIQFSSKEPDAFGATVLVGEVKLFIPMPAALKEKEKIRLEKEKEKIAKLIESTQQKLANEDFFSKAPKEVVEKLKNALQQSERQLHEISLKLSVLEKNT